MTSMQMTQSWVTRALKSNNCFNNQSRDSRALQNSPEPREAGKTMKTLRVKVVWDGA